MTTMILPAAISDGITWSQWVAATITIAVAVIFGIGGRWLIRNGARDGRKVNTALTLLARLVFGMIVALGFYVGLRIIGFDPAPLIAGAGVLGITLAFALRDIAANYISGILMGLRNPFRSGDQIISGEHEGTVEDLNLRYTTIRTYDGVRVLLPNGMVLQSPLTNLTVNGSRRTDIPVGVAYGTDLQKARQVFIDAVSALDGIDPEREVQAWAESLDASWITIRVRYWHAPRIADMWQMRSAALIAVVDAAAAAGIDLPFERTIFEIANKPTPSTDSL